MDMVGGFGHTELPRSLSRVHLLLCVELLQHLMVCVDVHFDTYLPVSRLPETVHDKEQFFVMDWPVALCGGEGFCILRNWMKVFASVDEVVLGQDTSNCLIVRVDVHDCH